MLNFLKYIKSDKGQSIIEFTLVFPIFALVFFAVVEFSHLFYVRLTLQHALREAGRYMVTGRADEPDPDNPGEALPREQAIEAIFDKWLMGTGTGLQDFAMNPADGGGAGETVTLTAAFTKPWFTILFDQFSPGGVTFNMSTTWVNERCSHLIHRPG